MRIYKAKDYNDLSRKAANILSAQIIMKPDAVLGLATGSSPIGIYKQLIEWYQKGDLDFSETTAVNLDEYVGLKKDDPNSYAFFMKTNLFDHINIDRNKTFIPDGMENDAERECVRYNGIIKACGGIDMQLLGIGCNGHIGFNEPGTSFDKETHLVTLSQNTIDANARFFDSISVVPKHAYSMGIKSIMQARRIVLVASGENKANALYESICGPITPQVPASILQLHNNVTVVADSDALSEILKHHEIGSGGHLI
ncbi:MAG: glucosamine-6-phosphate deaminase [Lachnospiraceae bacterium]|nr:glucosamine-6-phosphate deaminase [Lachnospiraceae bacterium]